MANRKLLLLGGIGLGATALLAYFSGRKNTSTPALTASTSTPTYSSGGGGGNGGSTTTPPTSTTTVPVEVNVVRQRPNPTQNDNDTVTVRVRNLHSTVLTNVVVSLAGTGYEIVQLLSSNLSIVSGNTVKLTVPSIAVGAYCPDAQLIVRLRNTGVVTITGTATQATEGTPTGQTSAAASWSVQAAPSSNNYPMIVSINRTDNDGQLATGATDVVNVTVTNQHPSLATVANNLILVCNLPSFVGFDASIAGNVSAVGQSISAILPSIAAGQSSTVSFRVKFNQAGSFTLGASLSSINNDSISGTTSGTVAYLISDSTPPSSSGVTFALLGQRMYMQGGDIKVGIDLAKGGVIAYLGMVSVGKNWVNISNTGNYSGVSYYGLPKPLVVAGHTSSPSFSDTAFNPVQAGDAGNNGSPVLEHYQVGTDTYYVKCRPLQWKFTDAYPEPSVIIESWYKLIPTRNAVQVINKITQTRSNTYNADGQASETPFIYVTRDLEQFTTYDGSSPYTNGSLSNPAFAYSSQWGANTKAIVGNSNPAATEKWCAVTNPSTGKGVGLYNPTIPAIECTKVLDLSGGTNDTDYPTVILQNTSSYNDTGSFILNYEYDWVLGSVNQIRQYAYDRHNGVV